MRLDPDSPTFETDLRQALGPDVPANAMEYWRGCLREAREANLPLGKRVIRADDFFPEKDWRVLAASGYIGRDPYTGVPGVTRLKDDTYEVTTQIATRTASARVRFVFRFLESFEQTRLIFSPLMERFMAGEDHKARAVKISDSGRIRNELQTLASQALEYDGDIIRVHFDRIDDLVMPARKKAAILEILSWYKLNHPVWFNWLDLA